jgi:hypothetical protein
MHDNWTSRFVVHILLFLFLYFLQGGTANPTFCRDFIVESGGEPAAFGLVGVPRVTNNNVLPNRIVIHASGRSADLSDLIALNYLSSPGHRVTTVSGQTGVPGLTTPEPPRMFSLPRRLGRVAAYALLNVDVRAFDLTTDSGTGILNSYNVTSAGATD